MCHNQEVQCVQATVVDVGAQKKGRVGLVLHGGPQVLRYVIDVGFAIRLWFV